jgi:pimeloyl-ACP methyl ester carboxylesterase
VSFEPILVLIALRDGSAGVFEAAGLPERELERLDDVAASALLDAQGSGLAPDVLWDSVTANFKPGMQDTAVDYHNDARPPLLFISGSEDHLMPPAIQRSNAKHYKSDTITEITEFEGPHLLPAKAGWEEVADYALAWAVEHAGARQPV